MPTGGMLALADACTAAGLVWYRHEEGEEPDDGELIFKAGDIVTVLEQDGEWWKGAFGGDEGLFPSNIVEQLLSAPTSSVGAAAVGTAPIMASVEVAVRRAGEEGGEHGSDGAFVFCLRKGLRDTQLAASVREALVPLCEEAGIDIEMVDFVIATRIPTLQATLTREQIVGGYWLDYAVAIYLYTMDNPKIYKVLNSAMHAPDRDVGRGGISPRLRACLPFIKFLDTALVSLPPRFHFKGRVNRGVKWAYPRCGRLADSSWATDHDPEKEFPVGDRFFWYEFKSCAQNFKVMYHDAFCGERGPRTIFTIEVCEGYCIEPFSHIPAEAEVMLRPLSEFEVVSAQKRLEPQHVREGAPKGGFPDEVVLQQLPRAVCGGGEQQQQHQQEEEERLGSHRRVPRQCSLLRRRLPSTRSRIQPLAVCLVSMRSRSQSRNRSQN
eukprot:COSAG01_NODE_5003_length_4531_cov_7.980687_2_plen_437_part_00